MFPMKVWAKVATGGISNQAKVIKLGIWEEGESLGENRSLRSGERLEGEVNNRVGRGDGIEVSS